MPYELRIGGRAEGQFDTSDEAVARAKVVVREDADRVVEVIDLSTGRPYAPASSADERDAMARTIR